MHADDAAATTLELMRRRRVRDVLPGAMKTADVDLFLVFTRESTPDPFAEEVGLGRVGNRAAGLFHVDSNGAFHRTAIAASMHAKVVEQSGIYDTVISYEEEGIRPHLFKSVASAAPHRIALNTSQDLKGGDGLTAGMRDYYLVTAIGPALSSRLVSSERILLAMLGRKFPEEIALIEQAAVATQEMLGEALSRDSIHPDVTTEEDIREALERKTKARQMTVAFMTIRLAARRLDDPVTDRRVRPGDLVSIDFGVVHQGYCSDIQRTAYVLRDGEGAAPADIQRMWDVTVAAHEAAFQSLRPGLTGLAVDSSARHVIEAAGFNGYPHAAGHSLGRHVHDVGPMLGPDWPERYGTLVHAPIQAGQVFAVEPMVYAHIDSQGGEVRIGLEDDVVVEEFGPRPFGTPQRQLIILS